MPYIILIVSCHIVSCHIISNNILYYVMLFYIIVNILYYVVLYHVKYIALCDVKSDWPYCIQLYCTILYFVMLKWQNINSYFYIRSTIASALHQKPTPVLFQPFLGNLGTIIFFSVQSRCFSQEFSNLGEAMEVPDFRDHFCERIVFLFHHLFVRGYASFCCWGMLKCSLDITCSWTSTIRHNTTILVLHSSISSPMK